MIDENNELTNDSTTTAGTDTADQLPDDAVESGDIQQAPQESWAQARERLKQEQEEKNHLREQNRFLMAQLQQQQKPQAQKEPDFDVESLPEDDFAMTKHLKETDRQYKQRIRQLEERQVALDMRDKYPDFKRVCSAENLKRLGQEDPVLAETVLLNPSLEKQWDMVYKAVKRSDFYAEDVKKSQKQSRTEEDEIAESNSLKPKPLSAARTSQSRSALGEARTWSRQMSDEEKAEQYKRAVAIANGLMNSNS